MLGLRLCFARTSARGVLAFVLGVALVARGAAVTADPSASPPPVRGLDPFETRFLAVPSASGALATSRALNAVQHFAGSPGDYRIAAYMRDRLRDAGFEAQLESYTGRIDTPKNLSLALVDADGSEHPFDLREGPVAGDPDGTRADAGLPFNYGSGDGDVRAPLVYAGRGRETDYAALASAGVDVKGAIVLVRYGAQFRGLLAERAQTHGAAGVIFYSDPADDGFGKGKVFPDGPYRPATSVQRGMVGDEPLNIPTLPVTATTAQALLATIDGTPPATPTDWKGALPVSYALGTSAHLVHLVVALDRRVGTMWNTVGILRGQTAQSVILGGHRDAWVYGVTDNGAGISTVIEVARAFGAMRKTGWVPRRTIVVAGWDAEEIGELGSQAYVNAHLADLKANCVAYLNADENVTGPSFGSDAAAAIANVVQGAARDLGIDAKPPGAPGGGSDHTTFLHGPGIPTAQIGFDGPLGAYHSSYDDLRFAQTIDPGFALHRKAAQVLGLIALRLTQDTPLPYRFRAYASTMKDADAKLVASANDAEKAQLAKLDRPLTNFDAATTFYDSASGEHTDPVTALAATRLLDPLLYGSIGYARSAFPAIAAALAAHDTAALSGAVDAATRDDLTAATSDLMRFAHSGAR
jgi:N-acetylated-alpha-linked acidic dipeptidase